MVGQRWAALSAEEKSHYAEVAAEVRRSSQGGPPGADSAGAGDEQALLRTRSDAATAMLSPEERQLRPHRRPRYYGPDFDTTDALGEEGAKRRKAGPQSTAADEADVLGLLADMRAEVIASDSAASGGGAAPEMGGDGAEGGKRGGFSGQIGEVLKVAVPTQKAEGGGAEPEGIAASPSGASRLGGGLGEHGDEVQSA